jgi:hypothetical protein
LSGYLEVSLVLSSLSFFIISSSMYWSRKSLKSIIGSARQNPPKERDSFFTGAYVDPTRYRTGVSAHGAVALIFALIGAVAVAIVYFVALEPLLLVAVAIEGYVVFTQLDSLEALSYARFIRTSSPDQRGLKDYAYIAAESDELRRGTGVFFVMGLASLLLSYVSDQAVIVSEEAVADYVRLIYGVSQWAGASSKPLSLVMIPLVLGASISIVIVVASRIGNRLSRHHREA